MWAAIARSSRRPNLSWTPIVSSLGLLATYFFDLHYIFCKFYYCVANERIYEKKEYKRFFSVATNLVLKPSQSYLMIIEICMQ